MLCVCVGIMICIEFYPKKHILRNRLMTLETYQGQCNALVSHDFHRGSLSLCHNLCVGLDPHLWSKLTPPNPKEGLEEFCMTRDTVLPPIADFFTVFSSCVLKSGKL